MKYNIINSGSDGNATIVEEIILIDCGVSFKKLSPYIKKLKLVFISHIHGDHFNKKTVKRLAEERPTLRFAVGEYLVEELVKCGVEKKNIDLIEWDKIYDYSLFKIKTFELFHDVENVGIKIYLNNKKLIYATDTNSIDHVSAKNYDVYLIEGNYINEEELHQRAVTKEYEERVKRTHLSQVKTNEWLLKNMGENSKYEFMHQHKEKGETKWKIHYKCY